MSTSLQENTASAPLLRVRDLKTYFRTKAGPARAVDGVSFELTGGETLALVGESGSGKSVTALSIMQLVPEAVGYQAGGSVEYLGRDITRLSEPDKRRLRGGQLAMIFQEPMTAPESGPERRLSAGRVAAPAPATHAGRGASAGD